MSPTNQTLISRFALAVSVFTLVMVSVVAATSRGGSSDASQVVAGPVPIALTEFALSPSAITVPKGGAIALSNNGTMAHNVSITGTSVVSPDLAAGEKATLDVSALAPGTYEIFCAIPGHKDSGMTGTLIVSDGSGGSAAAGADEVSGAPDMGSMNHDIGSLNPASDEAKAMNKRMEEAMTGGVETFLEYAKKYAAGEIEAGNEKIEPTILPDGTKQFALTAAITDWQVSPGKVVKAWTYNGRVPGPWLRVEPGDKVQVKLTNHLPVSTDIHWHGISVPNDQDGLAPLTQDFIRPFETYTYSFTAPDRAELGMYHAHMHGQEAIINGLFAVVQVGDVPLPGGRSFTSMTVPEGLKVDQEIPMVLNDAGVIGLSLNGKAFPETAPIVADKGDWILIHFYNEGLVGHPMHLHRQSQLVVAKDGFPLDAPYQADTIWISPGERYSVLVEAVEAGKWAFHCHIVSHAESIDGLFGMVTVMIVNE